MNELTLIFVGIAALIFVAIVAYSMLKQQKGGSSRQGDYVDPLFAELQQSKREQEPSTVVDSGSAEATAKPSTSPDDDGQTSSQVDTGAMLGEVATADQEELSDERFSLAKMVVATNLNPTPITDAGSSLVTELVARIKNIDPVEQQELLAVFRDHDFKFHRKVHIYGLNQLTDLWRDIETELPSARFVALGVAIQLADRAGAMSQKELHYFQQMALDFSNRFDAPFEFSMDIDEALKQAGLLDGVGRRFDSMAVLNVVPRAKTGFRSADIESCARDLMMSTDKNGIFVKTKGQKQNLAVLYRLACTDGSGHYAINSTSTNPVHDLVVYMNVPATVNPDRVFQEMVKDATNLATWLEGKVVDRNGKVMTQQSYTVLLQQISEIAFNMEQEGLVAGDAVSKKLF